MDQNSQTSKIYGMRINVYPAISDSRPVRERKWVRNIVEARSFCDWYERTFGQKVIFVICN